MTVKPTLYFSHASLSVSKLRSSICLERFKAEEAGNYYSYLNWGDLLFLKV
jgi:hypothetical protein